MDPDYLAQNNSSKTRPIISKLIRTHDKRAGLLKKFHELINTWKNTTKKLSGCYQASSKSHQTIKRSQVLALLRQEKNNSGKKFLINFCCARISSEADVARKRYITERAQVSHYFNAGRKNGCVLTNYFINKLISCYNFKFKTKRVNTTLIWTELLFYCNAAGFKKQIETIWNNWTECKRWQTLKRPYGPQRTHLSVRSHLF